MKHHTSFSLDQEVWEKFTERAKLRGLPSASSYMEFLIREDLRSNDTETLGAKVKTLAAGIHSLMTMNQVTFAAVWELVILTASNMATVEVPPFDADAADAFLEVLKVHIKDSINEKPGWLKSLLDATQQRQTNKPS